MTPKGLRKCRAVDGEENQKQVSRRRPRALGNRCRDSHIPAAPATTAMGKWKSKNRIPTFPQRLPCHHQKNQKRKEINPSPKPCPSGSSQDWNMLKGNDSVHIPQKYFPNSRIPNPCNTQPQCSQPLQVSRALHSPPAMLHLSRQSHQVSKMISDKQLEANRNNALLSTGPKTEEGRKRSSTNALRHGRLSLIHI